MKTPISTEGRVFVAQFTRDLAARQAAGAHLLSPGSKTWSEALRNFAHRVSRSGGPVKAAKQFNVALEALRTAQKGSACFVNCFARRSRSAMLWLLTYEVEQHQLTNIGNKGIAVRSHFIVLQRNGRISCGTNSLIAFVSWHALGRMYERTKVDLFGANGVVAYCGIAGLLLRESEKHLNTGINVTLEGMVCTGVLRVGNPDPDGQRYQFFDVVTVLPSDLYDKQKLAQGRVITEAVTKYITGDDADPDVFAEKIPILPFRDDDFVSRELKREVS